MKISIDESICKGCGLCIYYCPKAVIRYSNRRNEKGYIVAEVEKIEDCIDCKLCEICCPDFAIVVDNEKKSIHK